jgi:multicomponent Na+:H+ antiporter subunit G
MQPRSRRLESRKAARAGARHGALPVSPWVDALSWVCLVVGGAFSVTGSVGLLRMPDFYTRMHAASVIDTLGAGFILLGLVLQAGFTLVAAKLLMVGLLLFFTSPTATHALARAAMARGLKPLLAPDEEPSSKR